ncbi:MAG: radical SAM protein, partial [Alphaproteobacteria bacterium]
MGAKTISTDYLLNASLSELLARAARLRDLGHTDRLSYSRKVFIPLTRLCRDSCSYCTFATTPSHLPNPYLLPDEVLKIARDGKAADCKEALFTLGDKPELRYNAARKFLS